MPRGKKEPFPGKAVNLLLLKKFYERRSLMVLSDSSGSLPMFIGSEPKNREKMRKLMDLIRRVQPACDHRQFAEK
jgi:hypothetical protein